MSVAFRRESDEEHKEPRFELPIPAGPNRVTRRGLALIAERIATLDLALTSAEGDAVEATRRTLRYWHTRRTTAVLMTPPTDGSVGFGSVVTVAMAGDRRVIAIVGDDEADPAAGSIAFGAPLARALVGGEVGDVLPFSGRDDAIEILAIETAPAG